ncbi:hypothetical protein G9A89_022279 [Geosiphon pyriformis]|nr:hypothetical protein G9A89_022279 [Geosiphon pyriformis]
MNCHQYSPGTTIIRKREKERKNLSGTLTKPVKSATVKKTHQSGSGRKAIKKKGKEMKKTNLKPTKPPKPALVAGKKSIQLTLNQSHHVFLSSVKTATRSCSQWELGLHQTKTTGCTPITIANHATANATGIQRDKTSGTINHVLLVENNCLMKGCGMTFLVEKEHVMLCASTQSSSVTG